MKTFESFRNKLLTRVNLTENLAVLKPTTAEGSLFKSQVIAHISENAITLNSFAGMMRHMQMVSVKDTAVRELFENFSNIVKPYEKNLIIGMAMEGMNEADQTQLTSFVVMSPKSLHHAIIENKMDAAKTISPAITNLVYETKRQYFVENQGVREVTENFDVYTPVSYTEKTDKGVMFRVNSRIFVIGENGIFEERERISKKFVAVSNVLEHFSAYDEKRESMIVDAKGLGIFQVDENGISRINGDAKVGIKKERLLEEFRKHILTNGASPEVTHAVDAIICIHENIDAIVKIDNVKIVENKVAGEIIAMMVHENKSYVCTIKSTKGFLDFKEYGSITESVKAVQNLSGCDISGRYKKAIVNESKDLTEYRRILGDIDQNLKTVNETKMKVEATIKMYPNAPENTKKNMADSLGLCTEEIIRLTDLRKELIKQND